jgi:hypothetical protein
MNTLQRIAILCLTFVFLGAGCTSQTTPLQEGGESSASEGSMQDSSTPVLSYKVQTEAFSIFVDTKWPVDNFTTNPALFQIKNYISDSDQSQNSFKIDIYYNDAISQSEFERDYATCEDSELNGVPARYCYDRLRVTQKNWDGTGYYIDNIKPIVIELSAFDTKEGLGLPLATEVLQTMEIFPQL